MKILAIDDDREILYALKAVFETQDWGALMARNVKEGMELYRREAPDLILIDLHQPNMQPIHNIPKNIVYSGSKQNIKMTMVNGQILYENGEFASSIDVDGIYAKARKIKSQIEDRK